MKAPDAAAPAAPPAAAEDPPTISPAEQADQQRLAEIKAAARERARKEAAEAERSRFAEWKRLQEEAGFSVEFDRGAAEAIVHRLGLGPDAVDKIIEVNPFAYARVAELPDGPTVDLQPGGEGG